MSYYGDQLRKARDRQQIDPEFFTDAEIKRSEERVRRARTVTKQLKAKVVRDHKQVYN